MEQSALLGTLSTAMVPLLGIQVMRLCEPSELWALFSFAAECSLPAVLTTLVAAGAVASYYPADTVYVIQLLAVLCTALSVVLPAVFVDMAFLHGPVLVAGAGVTLPKLAPVLRRVLPRRFQQAPQVTVWDLATRIWSGIVKLLRGTVKFLLRLVIDPAVRWVGCVLAPPARAVAPYLAPVTRVLEPFFAPLVRMAKGAVQRLQDATHGAGPEARPGDGGGIAAAAAAAEAAAAAVAAEAAEAAARPQHPHPGVAPRARVVAGLRPAPEAQPERECSICMEKVTRYYLCRSQRHPICHDDFNTYVSTQAERDDLMAAGPEFQVPCPNAVADGEPCPPFTLHELRRQCDDETYNKVHAAFLRLREIQVLQAANNAPAVGRDPVMEAVVHITEEIMTLKCPQCHAAFIDFEGCMALNCSNCGCAFCGVCLQVTNEGDPHIHVGICAMRHPNNFVHGIFTDEATFNAFHDARKRAALERFLDRLAPNVRRQVEARLPR